MAIILFGSICSNPSTSIPQKFCRRPLLPAISFVLYLQSQSGTPSASNTWTSRYMSRGHYFWLSSKSWRTISVAMWYIFRLCMRNSCKTIIDFNYVRNRELNSIWHLIPLTLFWEINFLTKYTVRPMYVKTLSLVNGKEWPGGVWMSKCYWALMNFLLVILISNPLTNTNIIYWIKSISSTDFYILLFY